LATTQTWKEKPREVLTLVRSTDLVLAMIPSDFYFDQVSHLNRQYFGHKYPAAVQQQQLH
jgi:lipid A disaccharide synthetase